MPLFIILGLLYGLVSHLLQMKEFNWSVDQEAEAIGATIHEFVTNDFDLYFSKNPDGSLTVTDQFKQVIHRLSRQQDFLDISIYDPEMNLLYSRAGETGLTRADLAPSPETSGNSAEPGTVADEAIVGEPWAPAARPVDIPAAADNYEELAGLPAEDRPTYLHELDLATDNPVLSIYSLLYDANADTINETEGVSPTNDTSSPDNAFITVRKDAASFVAIHANISRWTVIEFLASVIAGLMVSLTLSFVLRRSVKDLHSKSGNIISGNIGTEQADSRIHEFNELGNTMQMLVNVLGKNVESYRKRIIENEQMRTTTEIASTFKTLANPAYNDVRFNRHIRYDFINDKAPGYFVCHLNLPEEMIIVTGCVDGSNPVETALESDALSRILLRKITSDETGNDAGISVDEAVKAIQKLLAKDQLRLDLVRVLKNGEVVIDHFEGLETNRTNYSKEYEEAVLVGHFPDALSNRINNYRRLLNGAYTEELFDDIKILSRGFETGVLVTIGPQLNRPLHEE